MWFFDNIIDLDRPILMKGKAIKEKLAVRIEEVQAEIDSINTTITTNYAQCLEGSLKAQQKRDLLKKLHEMEDHKVYLVRLQGLLKDRKNYALSIAEATSLKIVE